MSNYDNLDNLGLRLSLVVTLSYNSIKEDKNSHEAIRTNMKNQNHRNQYLCQQETTKWRNLTHCLKFVKGSSALFFLRENGK